MRIQDDPEFKAGVAEAEQRNQSELIRRYAPAQEEIDSVRMLLAGMNASNWIRKRNEALDILLGA